MNTGYQPDGEHQRMLQWCGEWKGTAQTYLEPGKPLEAPWSGRIDALFGGRFVRFAYQSSLQDKPLEGELTIAFESAERVWRTSWMDTFHTGTGILVSEGPRSNGAVDLRGRYFAAEGHPHWGWRTQLVDEEPGALLIRMFNISPEGQEDLGVEVRLRRA